MKIYNTPQQKNRYNINFEAVRIKQIAPEYTGLKRVFETELDTFTKKGDNAHMIGKGLSAAVYGFDRFKDIVFKKASDCKTDFAGEIRHLKILPDNLNTVQKFIAQAFDDETGIFYLLTTRMKGKPANAQTNPYKREHLSDLFGTMFELDKKGIYHGDFNLGNILLDQNGKVSLIDFQWMLHVEEKRFFENKPKIILPPFILNENSQMFEMASLPFYIKDLPNPKSFLKTYLKEKSAYHEKRGQYLRSLLPNWKYTDEKPTIIKGINFEDAQAILFRNPSKETLKVETRKLQFLSNFREAFSRQDINNPDGNFVTAPSAFLTTLLSLKELRQEIAAIGKQKYLSDAMKNYLSSTDEYAKYWVKNIASWTHGIFENCVKRAVNTEHAAAVKNFDDFREMPNILNIIDGRYKNVFGKNFDIKTDTNALELLNTMKSNHKKLKLCTLKMIFDTKVMKKQAEIKRINEQIKSAVLNDRGLEVINLSLLNIVKNRELKGLIAQKPNLKNRDEIITALHNERLTFEDLARETFENILNTLSK